MAQVSTRIDGCVNRCASIQFPHVQVDEPIGGGRAVDETSLPVVVVGAGPVGLAAAAHLLDRGLEPLVLEAGPRPAPRCAQWHHVRLFSPWSELVDPAAEKLLAPTGWRPPDPDGYPTGRSGPQQYLQPLADALGDRVRYGARVIGVARRGRDRVVDAGRDSEPLTVHVRHARRASSGSPPARWSTPRAPGRRPNPLGGDGLPALGESGRGRPDRLPGPRPRPTRPSAPGTRASGSPSPAAGTPR